MKCGFGMTGSEKARKYIGIIAAILAYYVVHEGAHLVFALLYGSFKQIVFLGFGVQIDVYVDQMTDAQLGLFCLAGAAATLITGYVLTACSGVICRSGSKLYRAIMYYVTIVMLLLDPLYLSVLCGLFGGGDMNGIARLVPELWARVFFGLVLAGNTVFFLRKVLPTYRGSSAAADELSLRETGNIDA